MRYAKSPGALVLKCLDSSFQVSHECPALTSVRQNGNNKRLLHLQFHWKADRIALPDDTEFRHGECGQAESCLHLLDRASIFSDSGTQIFEAVHFFKFLPIQYDASWCWLVVTFHHNFALLNAYFHAVCSCCSF